MRRIFFPEILIITFLVFVSIPFTAEAEKGEEKAEQEMEIKGIAFDQTVQSPVVLLTDKEQNSLLPIWIGLCEARSIELGLSEIVVPRPLTYDMMAAIVRTIGAKVERIVIVDLRDEVFYAQVEVSVGGKVSKIDARPSDAIALASRMNSPIFVKKTVLEKAAITDSDKEKQGL
jgi:bifunctional DNase/RNase